MTGHQTPALAQGTQETPKDVAAALRFPGTKSELRAPWSEADFKRTHGPAKVSFAGEGRYRLQVFSCRLPVILAEAHRIRTCGSDELKTAHCCPGKDADVLVRGGRARCNYLFA